MSIRVTGQRLVTMYDPSRAYKGYTLFGTTGTRDIWLIDMQGQFVHHWELPKLLGVYGKLLPNGNLLVGIRVPDGPMVDMPGSGGELLELDWDSNVVWKYEDLYINSHDWDRMKNGNTLIAHWVPLPNDIASKVKGGRPGSERDGVIWDDCLRVITPEGKVEWDWTPHEHMDFARDIICPLCSRITWIYVNSLFVLPDGNILTSLRYINTIAIIDKDTGELKWRWGPGELGHQHDATMLDNGNILVFDNGLHRLSSGVDFSHSRVLEVNPETDEIVWEYRDKTPMSFYASIMAGAQRLPNGNTLICDATKGRIFEVTPEKEIVWEFFNPFYTTYRSEIFGLTNLVYRAYRYGPDYEGLEGKTLDPDKFEWVLQEKGKLGTAEVYDTNKEKVLRDRLKRLGY